MVQMISTILIVKRSVSPMMYVFIQYRYNGVDGTTLRPTEVNIH